MHAALILQAPDLQRQKLRLGDLEKVGGRDRDRTGDPLLAKQVLSQLSYTPTRGMTLSILSYLLAHGNSENSFAGK
jgi:hypothetical protein